MNAELLELELERRWEKAAREALKRKERDAFVKWLLIVIGVTSLIVWVGTVLKP